jgi:hypothetical protein
MAARRVALIAGFAEQMSPIWDSLRYFGFVERGHTNVMRGTCHVLRKN